MDQNQGAGLGACHLVAFVGCGNPERARAFYGQTLGLELTSDELPFALVFDTNGTSLRVTPIKQVSPAQHTVLGWEVPDIVKMVRQLSSAGVVFEQYPFIQDSEGLGIWTAPGGARVAWFKDPDGNVLSLSQHPKAVG